MAAPRHIDPSPYGDSDDAVMPAAPDDDALHGLTDTQRRAVTTTEGPLLVLAGPGSGKTRVITRRIAYLIRCGVPAWQILALTFTNKAAAEMKARVAAILGEGPMTQGLTVTTFHALGARLLRRYALIAELPGLTPTFAIYDAADQQALMKRTIADLGFSTSNFPVRSALEKVSSAKNQLLDAAGFAAAAFDFQTRQYAKIYAAYEKSLRKAAAVDFDDLLVLTAAMLRTRPRIRGECTSRWKYLLIDEYQDTNRAQFAIAALLANSDPGEPHAGDHPPNICVVGDPDQSIYGWRGADITNILDFETQFPGATVIPLGENFRSTACILGAADALIRRNTRRKHKDLIAHRGPGRKVEVAYCREEHHEAQVVVDWFRSLRDGDEAEAGVDSTPPAPPAAESAPATGLAWKDFAVLYRTNSLSRILEDRFRSAGIPYVIARGTAYFQREEVKHAVAYLRIIANPADDVSLERIINTPARGIGDASFAAVQSAAARYGRPVLEALRGVARNPAVIPGVSTRAAAAIGRFIAMLDGWVGEGFMGTEAVGSLPDLVSRIIRESGLEAMYKSGRTDTDEERLENLAELVNSAAEFESEYDPTADPAADPAVSLSDSAAQPATFAAPPLLSMLRAYLERITLVADADSIDPDQGAVTLMTLHAAKGLEFRAAALIGLEENCLPHARAQFSDDDLEEERRLCFVGMTRAMDRLLLTCSQSRSIRGLSERTIPSRFLDEIPPSFTIVCSLSNAASWDADGSRDSTGEDDTSGWDDDGAPRTLRRGPAKTGLDAGDLVRHPQFGLGRIIGITRGAQSRAQVHFHDVGVKTLVLEYARLEKIR